MTTREFESIKEKIEEAKQSKARAEGAISSIEDQWKREFEVSDILEAKKKLEKLNEKVDNNELQLESLMHELGGITDWDAL